MKFIDEYRNPDTAQRYADALTRITTQPWTIMEVCGGQTHALVKFGVDRILPPHITLLHGPGCPVCVTSTATIDKALAIAGEPNVIFCTFGDMMRVPGSSGDLFAVRAGGGDVRMLYSPLDALAIAEAHPCHEVVFFAVGFETTAPAIAMAVYQARRKRLGNFSILASHVRVPPAIESLLTAPGHRIQGFLAAGHVCTVMGYTEYEPIAHRHHVPIVVTGFEPVDLLQGIFMCVKQLEEGRAEVENQYSRSVSRDGNTSAQRLMAEVFRPTSRQWRGIGEIPHSGLALAPEYAEFDAERRFSIVGEGKIRAESGECISGQILQGLKKPPDCPAFKTACTPDRPLGVTMVSAEGACSAYYLYRNDRP
jgi:hydrogenase expression/formation protein HypD